MERNELLQVMTSYIKKVPEFYSKNTSDEIRNALIEANGGSTKLDRKSFYRGSLIFSLVEELIPVMIDEGIRTEQNPIFQVVDYKNVAAGDENAFTTEGDGVLVVSTAAKGILGVRRQRLASGQTITVDTKACIVRVYEPLTRLLAGQIDFDRLVNAVYAAFKADAAQKVIAALEGITAGTAGLTSEYVKTGSYVEATMLDLVAHVEAANGKPAKIIGTKKALRNLAMSIVADAAKDDLYNMGYYGKFFGTDVYAVTQAHKPGTDTFAMDDTRVYVVAADDKFIKFVRAGEGILAEKDGTTNADATAEYVYAENIGVGVICANKIGVYDM